MNHHRRKRFKPLRRIVNDIVCFLIEIIVVSIVSVKILVKNSSVKSPIVRPTRDEKTTLNLVLDRQFVRLGGGQV